jgi:hypothetical protein
MLIAVFSVRTAAGLWAFHGADPYVKTYIRYANHGADAGRRNSGISFGNFKRIKNRMFSKK